MRFADLSVRLSARLQSSPKPLSQISLEVREILRKDLIRMGHYNLSAARAHLDDLERRLALAAQTHSVFELLRLQIQRTPETGMRVAADVMRNIDIVEHCRTEIRSLLRNEIRKQWLLEREAPAVLDHWLIQRLPKSIRERIKQ